MKTLHPLARLAVLFTLVTTAAQGADILPVGSDNFAAAPEINTANGVSEYTNLTNYTAEWPEPPHHPAGSEAGGKSAWWSWTAPESGFCTVDTRETSGLGTGITDTVMGVYQGSAINNLTVLARNDDYSVISIDSDNYLSSITFYAVSGTTYKIAVDAYSPASVTASNYDVRLRVRLVPFRKMVRSAVYHMSDVDDNITDMGSLTLTTTGTGRFTGKLVTRTKTHPLKGAFGADGFFTYTFEPPFKNGVPQGVPTTLTLDIAGDGYFLLQQGSLRSHDYFPERAVYTKISPAPTAGQFTGGFPKGFVSATVSPLGVIKGTGSAPDGTSFTFSSALHKSTDPTYFSAPIYVPMHSKKGGLVIEGYFHEEGVSDFIGGAVTYQRPPAPGATFYPQGLISTLSLAGHTYTPPASGSRAMNFLNANDGLGSISFYNENGELPNGSFSELLTLTPANKFIFATAARKSALKLNVKTGVVTGSINEPAAKKRVIKGALVDGAGGLLIEGNVSGSKNTIPFTIAP